MEDGTRRKPKRRGGRRKRSKKFEATSTSFSTADNSHSSEQADGVVQDVSSKRKRRADKSANKEKKARLSEERTNDDSSRLSGEGGVVNSHDLNNSKKKQRQLDGAKPQVLSKSSSFIEKMKARLSGGHFRMINEKLYTCSGDEALKYFNKDPVLFDAYHTGYQEQMSHWPEQPVNLIIKWLKGQKPSVTVADFGCGNAHLAKSVVNKVFSIDLVSSDPSVIACDMANTPLKSSSVDVAVFCLSLMGTSYPSYIQEACRVLKPRGWLLIAEVKSRFDPNNGGADPNKFVHSICELGFTSTSKDFSNKMFILWHFRKKEKQETERKEIEWPQLKACIYKRR